MYGKPMTVDERAQRTGFLSGPSNRMVNQSEAPKEEASPAPNYRPADDPAITCSDCAHYDLAERSCKQFNFPAKPQYVCDAWADPDAAAVAAEEPMMAGEQQFGGE